MPNGGGLLACSNSATCRLSLKFCSHIQSHRSVHAVHESKTADISSTQGFRLTTGCSACKHTQQDSSGTKEVELQVG